MSYISAAQAKQIARKAVDNLKDGTLVPKLSENWTPYAEDSGTIQTQPFFLEGTATGNGESRVDAKQVPAYAFLQEKRGNMVTVNQLADCQTITTPVEANNISSKLFTYYPGHTYLCCFDYKIEANIGNIYFLYGVWNNSVTQYSRMRVSVSSLSGRFQFIFNPTQTTISDYSSVKILLQMLGTDISETNKVTTSNVAFIDLTQWFNGNIPAYLLSHPEAFGRYYRGHLAYEPGRLEPATGRYLTSIGRNTNDEVYESGRIGDNGTDYTQVTSSRSANYLDAICNASYYCYGNTRVDIVWYDKNKIFIKKDKEANINPIKTAPSNAYFYRIVLPNTAIENISTAKVTISLYYPGESGYDKYYPHEVLATIDTGTELLYSAGSAYDSKVPSGLITRRIASVDLGTLNWNFNSQSSLFVAFLLNSGNTLNVLCNKYTASAEFSTTSGIIFFANSSYIAIRDDSYTDAVSFKAAMSGVMLYYELATPTTEQGTPFQENVPIDDFGQLSWSDTDVPQGNQIFYPVDYKAYEDTLIKYTDGDATSLVRKIDYASLSQAGVVKVALSKGFYIDSNGNLYIRPADKTQIKAGVADYNPINGTDSYYNTFYSLSKAAGVNLASSTEETAPDGTNPGVYPAAAKTAIQNMLGIINDAKSLKYTQIPFEIENQAGDPITNPEVAGNKFVKIPSDDKFQLHACAAKFNRFTLNLNGLTKVRQRIDDFRFGTETGDDDGPVYYASVVQGLIRNDLANIPTDGHSIIIAPRVFIEEDDTENIYFGASINRKDPFITGAPINSLGGTITPDSPDEYYSSYMQISTQSASDPDFTKENCPIKLGLEVEYTFDYPQKKVNITIDVLVTNTYTGQELRRRFCTNYDVTTAAHPDFVDGAEYTWQPIITAAGYNLLRNRIPASWVDSKKYLLTFNDFISKVDVIF